VLGSLRRGLLSPNGGGVDLEGFLRLESVVARAGPEYLDADGFVGVPVLDEHDAVVERCA